jgi:hypothetical protein
MLTLPVDAWIGNAAAVVSGAWGAVTRRAQQSGYSRTAIYEHADRVVQAVANEQASGVSYEDLWAENEQLKSENEALWQAWSETEDLSESKQRELVSAGCAMGLRLTQIVVLLADCVAQPDGAHPGHGGALGAAKCSAVTWHPGGPRSGVSALGAGVVSG